MVDRIRREGVNLDKGVQTGEANGPRLVSAVNREPGVLR